MGFNPFKAIERGLKHIGGELSDAFDSSVDFVVDIVESTIGFLTPEIDIPDFGQINAEQNARGVLVNKLMPMLLFQ
jgi:hypothetical protein